MYIYIYPILGQTQIIQEPFRSMYKKYSKMRFCDVVL